MDAEIVFWILASAMEPDFSFFPPTDRMARELIDSGAIGELRAACELRLAGGPFPPYTFTSLTTCQDILKRFPNIELKWLKFSGFEREIIIPD